MLAQFNSRIVIPLTLAVMCTFALPTVSAQDKRIVDALKIKPRFPIDIDTPTLEEMKSCRIAKAAESLDEAGWLVFDNSGRLLRMLLDKNKDRRLDQWSYFKDGIEVYREIDTDFNEKINHFRWMGTAGTRWGVDENEDGELDYWQVISPEEITYEIFEAVKDRDARRFARVLVSPQEIESLNLGSKMTQVVTGKAKTASTRFASFAQQQDKIGGKAKWLHFGTTRPSLIAAGTEGLKRDVVFYDHASAVIQSGDDFEQLAVGSIVKVGDTWRAIELPQIVADGTPVLNGGVFFPMPDSAAADIAQNTNPQSEKIGELSEEWNKIESQLSKASKPRDIARLEEKRFDIMTEFVSNSSGEDRQNWLRILADTATDSYQRNRFPDAIRELRKFQKQLARDGIRDLVDYTEWRIINAEFSRGLDGDQDTRAEATDNYMEALEEFVGQYADSEFTSEGMIILATNYEVADVGNPQRALGWYERLAKDHADSDAGKKAQGAILRLTGEGKKIRFVGKTLNDQTFNLAADNLRGKIILIHYWQDWCDVCKKDFSEFQRLASKYRGKLLVVGANLDDTDVLEGFMAKNKDINWAQLSGPGGTETSPLAQQLGVSTLPMVVLIDQEGRLVDSNIAISEVERAVQRLVNRKSE